MTTPSLKGATLRHWREEADMGLTRAASAVSDVLGYEISTEYIRRMETGFKAKEDWDTAVVLALAHVYRRKVKDLADPDLIANVERLWLLIDRAGIKPPKTELPPPPGPLRRRTRTGRA